MNSLANRNLYQALLHDNAYERFLHKMISVLDIPVSENTACGFDWLAMIVFCLFDLQCACIEQVYPVHKRAMSKAMRLTSLSKAV